jgi:HPt (histidine-containing phosphotransfer) domain-containing protein
MGAFTNPEVANIIGQFLKTLDERIAVMAEASTANNFELLSQLAHQLVGSAANCGFPALAELCRLYCQSPRAFDGEALGSAAERAQRAWAEETSDPQAPQNRTSATLPERH